MNDHIVFKNFLHQRYYNVEVFDGYDVKLLILLIEIKADTERQALCDLTYG